MEQALAAMWKPFPELINLTLKFYYEEFSWVTWPLIPDSFLGESEPRLQSLQLMHIPFPVPALQKTSFVCNRPCQNSNLENSEFLVHFIRRNRHLPFHFDQARSI